MGRVTFDNFRDKFLNIEFPTVLQIPTFLEIDVYDDVLSFSLTNKSNNIGFGTDVSDNEKDISEFITETGNYEIEINTQSDGVLIKDIEIQDVRTTLVFNKIDFDFELRRVDNEGNRISNTATENLAETFVSTDNVRILFFQLENYDLQNDGNSCGDIIWEVEGETDNDGTVIEQNNGEEDVYEFIPNPINRPNQAGNGSRQPNIPIGYTVNCTILGLKRSFELEQDGKSVLRQEYIDYGTNWQPTRAEIFADNGDWNTGNYSTNADFNTDAANYPYNSGYIAARGQNRFQEIWDQLLINYSNFCTQAGINNNGLTVNSSYRNPQRNNAVGSVLINSNHTIGHAMDISLVGPRTSQRWNFLHNAGEQINGVNAICEIGPTQVSCDNPNVSHVHLAW